MKNLENYGVQKMNTKEIRDTNGGDFGITLGLIALGITILSTDWDEVGDSISRGWNDAR